MGKAIQTSHFISMLEEVNTMSRIMGKFMTDYDVLLLPAVTRPPFKLGTMGSNRKLNTGFDYWLEEMPYYTTAPLFNITGQPAISLPLYWTNEDLPLGVQLVASIGRDDLLFQIANQLEQARPWFNKYPPIHIIH